MRRREADALKPRTTSGLAGINITVGVVLLILNSSLDTACLFFRISVTALRRTLICETLFRMMSGVSSEIYPICLKNLPEFFGFILTIIYLRILSCGYFIYDLLCSIFVYWLNHHDGFKLLREGRRCRRSCFCSSGYGFRTTTQSIEYR